MYITERELQYLYDHIIIMVDDREKEWSHIKTYFEENNINYKIKRMQSGDYSFILSYDDNNYSYVKKIVVERKNSLSELASCFAGERTRFEREFMRLKNSQTKCFMIIENDDFDGIMKHKYYSKLHPNSLESSMLSWLIRYDIVPIFTKKENVGRIIYNIFKMYIRNQAKEESQ